MQAKVRWLICRFGLLVASVLLVFIPVSSANEENPSPVPESVRSTSRALLPTDKVGIMGDSMGQASHTNDTCNDLDIVDCLESRLGYHASNWSMIAGSTHPWSIPVRLGYTAGQIVNVTKDGDGWNDAYGQAQSIIAAGGVRDVIIHLGHNEVSIGAGQSYAGRLDEAAYHMDNTLTYLTDNLPAGGTIYMSDIVDIVKMRDVMVNEDNNYAFNTCQGVWDLNIDQFKDETVTDACRHYSDFRICDSGRVKRLLIALLSAWMQHEGYSGPAFSGKILWSGSTAQDRAEAAQFNKDLNALMASKAAHYNGRNNVAVRFSNRLYNMPIRPYHLSKIDCYHANRLGQIAMALEMWRGFDPRNTDTQTVIRDSFRWYSYNDNYGNTRFTDAWTEINDDGNPLTGGVTIDLGKGLKISDSYRGIQRSFNLSNASTAFLSYNFQRHSLNDPSELVSVEISSDGGATWTQLATHGGVDEYAFHRGRHIDITPYISLTGANAIRFMTSWDNESDEGIYLENVTIHGWNMDKASSVMKMSRYNNCPGSYYGPDPPPVACSPTPDMSGTLMLNVSLAGGHVLYSCVIPATSDYFISLDPNCEGNKPYGGLIGYSWLNTASGRQEIFRCRLWNGMHMVSESSTCDGIGENEGSLGFHRTLAQTVDPKGAYLVDDFVNGSYTPPWTFNQGTPQKELAGMLTWQSTGTDPYMYTSTPIAASPATYTAGVIRMKVTTVTPNTQRGLFSWNNGSVWPIRNFDVNANGLFHTYVVDGYDHYGWTGDSSGMIVGMRLDPINDPGVGAGDTFVLDSVTLVPPSTPPSGMLVDNYDDGSYTGITFTDANAISESGGFLTYGTPSGADVSHTHSNLNIMSSAYRRVILRMKTTHPGSDLSTRALDGSTSTIWHSGASAPGWIRVDLGADRTIARVKLLTSMSTSGSTSHTVRLLNSSLTPIASTTLTNASTADNTWLEWVIAKSGVRYMDVKTTASPCQVAWREIQVCSADCGTNYAEGKTAIASTTRSTWTGTGKLYWDFGTGIGADRNLSFTVYPDGQWRTYNLDVGNNANWKGTIKALRIDAHDSPASQSGATFAFDYLTVTD